MSQAQTLSASDQPVVSAPGKKVSAEIEAQDKANLQHIKHHALGATTSFAAAALLFGVCPPAGLGFAAATLTAAVGTAFAGRLGGDLLTRKTLETLKKNMGHPAFASQISKKARKLYKFAKAAGIISGAGAFVALGAIVTTLFAPGLALPLLYSAGLAAFGGGLLASMGAQEAGQAAEAVGSAAQKSAPAAPSAPAVELTQAPAVVTRLPSLKADFSASIAAKPYMPAMTPAPQMMAYA